MPSEEAFTAIDSIGHKIAESLNSYFQKAKNLQLIERLKSYGLNFEVEEEQLISNKLADKTFVLTGTLPTLNRNQAKELIEQHGGKTSSSVSKNTNYVLAGDSPGSKMDKAKKLNIEILTEEEFLKLIQ